MAHNAADDGRRQRQQGGGWGPIIITLLAAYFAVNFVFKPKTTGPVLKDLEGQVIQPVADGSAASLKTPNFAGPAVITPLFEQSTYFDMYVYFTERLPFQDYDNPKALIWVQRRIIHGDYSEGNYRTGYAQINISEHMMKNNGSAWAHIVFVPSGKSPNPNSPSHNPNTFFYDEPLVVFWPEQRLVKTKNLMTGEEVEKRVSQPASTPSILSSAPLLSAADTPPVPLVPFWKPNLTLTLVDDQTHYPSASLPQQLRDHMRFTARGEYYPTIFVKDFWLLKEKYIPVNETTPQLNLSMSFEPISMMKWQLFMQLEQSFQMQMQMGAVNSEIDEVRRMLLETNPVLLATTVFVSVLHMVFDFLAFKNDISFWKNRKSMEGLSVRTLFLNFFSQIVIFLYLMDNDTSWMILLSSGVGLFIEGYKITRAVVVKIRWENGLPRFSYEDRDSSYANTTKQFDEQAMRYLSWLLLPLVVGYSIYSLYYNTHKSWYSWLLSSLTGAIYTFGFITMTPQLFINYKLRSVAHLPWKSFMYKALNTFVDDLFAFIIKMPTLHRLACFRDDIIFLIYLYQRWLYPVDKKRVNEFGQGGEDAPAQAPNNATAVPVASSSAPAPASAAKKTATNTKKSN